MKRPSMKRLGFAITSFATSWILSSAASLLLPATAMAVMQPNFTAKIYDLKDRSKHMFNYVSEVEFDGDSRAYVNRIMDLEGNILVLEKTIAVNGGRTVLLFEQEQRQVGSVGKIEVREGKIFFSYAKDGKAKTDDEKSTDDFIVTSTLVANLKHEWEKIAKGETVKFRLGVVDRLETVGFQVKKEGDKLPSGGAGQLLKMKPSSVIISALVNPLRLGFDSEGQQLLEIEGRTPVKVKVDGKWKDFDGYTVYNYTPPPKPVAPPASPTPAPEKKPATDKKPKKKS